VSGGAISIASVTGDIVITAVADIEEGLVALFTNLAEPNTTNTTDWSIWCNDARFGNSDGGYRQNDGTIVSNYIPYDTSTGTHILRVKGMTDVKVAMYKSDKSFATYSSSANTNGTFTKVDGDYTEWNSPYGTVAYVRVEGVLSGTVNDVIITVDEEIKYGTPEDPTNFCIPLGDGWISGGRCSSAGADREDSEQYAVTNYIAVQNGDIVYVKNLDIATTIGSGLYKSDENKTAIGGFTMPSSGALSGYVKDVDLSGEWEQFTIDNANAGYVRICGIPSNVINSSGSKFEDKYDINNLGIIVNIKRNGVWL